MIRTVSLALAAAVVLVACASAQRPVLYPNAHLKNVGDASAQRDIDDCMRLADDAGVAKSNNQVARSGAQGAAVTPGRYTATLGKQVGDTVTPYGAGVSFQVRNLER